MTSQEVASQVEENVRVVVRCRPPISSESTEDDVCVEVDEGDQCIVIDSRQFTFDRVFGFESGHEDLFEGAPKAIVDSAVEGYNGTIFAYGQTGTGKTFTVSGILERSFAHIFHRIDKSSKDIKFLVRASYFEIYNEEIRDLLKRDKKLLELKETKSGVQISNLSTVIVENPEELMKLKVTGEKHRAIASTNMNLHSSRSHTIFTAFIEQQRQVKDGNRGTIRVGKLHLVDLAGSERQSKSGTSGDRLKEAAKINLSLTCLSLVIAALTDPKAAHIPYRNSKLTRFLSDSLGGNSKTLLIACIGPMKSNMDESISTLRFASTAKKIKNKARINEDSKETLLRKFQQQIEELRQQLEAAEQGDDGEGDAVGGNKPNAAAMAEKLKMLEQKIVVGGENLLEKAERQEKQLAETDSELETIRRKEQELKDVLEQKNAEILQIEGSYESLNEEVAALNKKLKKAYSVLSTARSELHDTQGEYVKLREELLDTIRATNKELKLTDMLIHHYIPDECLEMIQESSKYNESIGEWQIKNVAFTGNNLKKETRETMDNYDADDYNNFQSVYLSYKH